MGRVVLGVQAGENGDEVAAALLQVCCIRGGRHEEGRRLRFGAGVGVAAFAQASPKAHVCCISARSCKVSEAGVRDGGAALVLPGTSVL